MLVFNCPWCVVSDHPKRGVSGAGYEVSPMRGRSSFNRSSLGPDLVQEHPQRLPRAVDVVADGGAKTVESYPMPVVCEEQEFSEVGRV